MREGDALERLADVSKITFDKTGTLTYGTPKVTEAVSLSDYDKNEIYAYAAAVEKMSEHPLGKAIVKSYGETVKTVKNFKMIPGEGVAGTVDNKEIKAGNLKLLFQNKESKMQKKALTETEMYINAGCTVIYVAINGELAGYIVLSDTVREECKQTIANLKKIGVRPVLLTGDNKNAANKIADEVGIKEVYANCLPEDKLNYIGKLQKENRSVCMIGDGVNDAPALKTANVGIAMGGIGSDIAVDAADIVLVDDEVKELPHLINLSRRMMTTIKCNLTFSMGLNFVAVILAVTGTLNPVVGALVHNAGSVLVIINSAFLLKWKKRKNKLNEIM